MGRKKIKKSDGGGLIIIVVIAAIYMAIKQLWPLLVAIAAIVVIIAVIGAIIDSGEKTKETTPAQAKSDTSFSPKPSKRLTPNYAKIEWLGIGEKLDLGTNIIIDPMTYYSKDMPPEQGIGEASCIYRSLPIGVPIREARGALGYWPQYSAISRDQRANYLEWLSNGRRGNLEDIGYAFLYFYGIERRLLIEKKDFDDIVIETLALLNRYKFSGSWWGYLSRFLAYVVAREGVGKLDEKLFKSMFEDSPNAPVESGLALALAWFYEKGAPLPSSWAMKVVQNNPQSPRSVVVDRVPTEFKSLLEKKYKDKYGEGLILKAAQRPFRIEYGPASPSLLYSRGGYRESEVLSPIEIPNVLGIQSQFKSCLEIWTECIEELRAFSGKIGKGVTVNSRAAYEALPEELKKETEHPDRSRWEKIISDHAREDGVVLTKLSNLADIQGFAKRDKLTLKQSNEIVETADCIGYGVEPDTRTSGKPYNWEDIISLFSLEGKPIPPTNSQYLAATTMLELGMSIAAADGTIEPEEVRQVTKFLEGQFLLEPDYIKRLESLKEVFLTQPPSLNRIGKRLHETLKPEQLEKVGHFLVGIAAADGKIVKSEFAALKRAYKAMGLGEEKLAAFIDSIRSDLVEPVEVKKGKKAAKGEAIPLPQEAEAAAVIYLDENRIMSILQETKEVSLILGNVFGAEIEEQAPAPPAIQENRELIDVPVDAGRFENLDAKYHYILSEIITQAQWEKKIFEELCRKFHCMPSGLLDVINSWSDEYLGDLLIEEGDPLIINRDLLKEK